MRHLTGRECGLVQIDPITGVGPAEHLANSRSLSSDRELIWRRFLTARVLCAARATTTAMPEATRFQMTVRRDIGADTS
jgi:hypothetical protein